jgi:hypothetical protein
VLPVAAGSVCVSLVIAKFLSSFGLNRSTKPHQADD